MKRRMVFVGKMAEKSNKNGKKPRFYEFVLARKKCDF